MRTRPLDWRALSRISIVAIPVAFGLWSVILGADANWDLYNYHLYNPYALLNGRLETDLAPGGLQSYFNPLLDVPYFLAISHLPGPLVGFGMGILHGLNFVLVYGICRSVLGKPGGEDAYRIPLLLALAGSLTANFLSELGNTMGDNTTALFCLASVLLTLHAFNHSPGATGRRAFVLLMAAGIAAGIAAGLKLTNAVYAAAFCIALAVVPIPAPGKTRVFAVVIFVFGAALGMALGAGFWMHRMWQAFANPLFPQFGSLFPNPLAAAGFAVDTMWLPAGWGERLAWPFLISIDARKAGQLPILQVLWAIVYVLFMAWGVVAVLERVRGSFGSRLDPKALYVVVAVGAAFVIWMNVFGIYRYLVTSELLAPLAIYVLAKRVFGTRVGTRVAAWSLATSTVVAIVGLKTWGHVDWASEPFEIDAPQIAEPSRATALLVGGDPPWSWIALGLPPELALVQVGGNFPEGPAFKPRVHSMLASRGGPAFALVTGHYDSSGERGRKLRKLIEVTRLAEKDWGCAFLRSAVRLLRARYEVRTITGEATPRRCELLPVVERPRPIETENHAERQKAAEVLARYGFALAPSSCSRHLAKLGGALRMYQWCEVAPMSRASS